MDIYKSLIESYRADELKETMRTNLTQFQKLVDKYINEDEEKDYSNTLGMMLKNLNNVIKLLSSMRIYL